MDQVQSEQFGETEGEREFSRLLNDSDFTMNARGRALLTYLIHAKLRGEAYIDPRDIAIDVLGRSRDFNSMSDPIVRIEMARLRAGLRAYYELNRTSAVCIVIAPRNYVPVFEYREFQPVELPAELPVIAPKPAPIEVKLSDTSTGPGLLEKLEFYALAVGSSFVIAAGVALTMAVR